MTMKVESLGHVVLKVTDLERSEKFYAGLLGMEVCARFDDQGYEMTFFTLGNHHDLAIMKVTGDAPVGEQSIGMHHVAFRIGDSMDQLREAKDRLDEADVAYEPIDHDVTKSLYLDDPDGNTLELYVDVSNAWRGDPQRIAQVGPLEI